MIATLNSFRDTLEDLGGGSPRAVGTGTIIVET
jgi:hypothetical protein